MLVEQGNLPAALDAFNASLRLRERLAKADPGNAGWIADLAASYGKIGQLHAARGDIAQARQCFEAGRAIIAPMVQKAPDVALWQQHLRSFDAAIARLV